MNYLGNYISNNIYGTRNNNKIEVETTEGANFLLCTLTVVFNNETWTHLFEIPFFNNKASFYFEKYIHSIITQKFTFTTPSSTAFSFVDFPLADVTINIKEMDEATILEELEHVFKMTLGTFTTKPIADFTGGEIQYLEQNNTFLHTANSFFTVSFLATTLPTKLIVNDVEISLPTVATTQLLHTLIVPVSLIKTTSVDDYDLKLTFAASTISIADITLLQKPIEQTLMLYQNEIGTISILEFTGDFKDERLIKTEVSSFIENNVSQLKTSNISKSFPFFVNTGYILEESKYNMIFELLASFNIALFSNSTLRMVVLNGSHKITPYITNYYALNETLKFKLAKNDHPNHRLF